MEINDKKILSSQIILTCGISGSGKTEFSQSLERYGFIRLSSDETIWRKYGDDFPSLPPARQRDAFQNAGEVLLSEALRLAREGRRVVVDSTMCKQMKREHYRDVFAENSLPEPLIVYFDTPLPVLRRRLAGRKGSGPNDQIVPESDLLMFHAHFERPDECENVVVINSQDIV